MTCKVKICGLSEHTTLAAALDNGADYVGFVFYTPSPRHVDIDAARDLAAAAQGRATTVALMVDPDDHLVHQVVSGVAPDMIQLHGGETPDRCSAIRAATGCPIIKAVKVETRADVEAGLGYAGTADLILFDAKAPRGFAGALPGGNGLCFDWHLLDGIADRQAFMLSGGLDASNVAAAIGLTGATAVDVSSGVESAPGVKDARLIARFLAAAKRA